MKAKVKNRRNIFIRIITIPLRVLAKARELYVKGMTSYAEKMPYSHSTAGNGHFSRSFSASSTWSSHMSESDFKELVRAASVRSYGHKNEVDMHLQELIKQLREEQQKNVLLESLPKDKSVRAVGMGRIEECEEEDC